MNVETSYWCVSGDNSRLWHSWTGYEMKVMIWEHGRKIILLMLWLSTSKNSPQRLIRISAFKSDSFPLYFPVHTYSTTQKHRDTRGMIRMYTGTHPTLLHRIKDRCSPTIIAGKWIGKESLPSCSFQTNRKLERKYVNVLGILYISLSTGCRTRLKFS